MYRQQKSDSQSLVNEKWFFIAVILHLGAHTHNIYTAIHVYLYTYRKRVRSTMSSVKNMSSLKSLSHIQTVLMRLIIDFSTGSLSVSFLLFISSHFLQFIHVCLFLHKCVPSRYTRYISWLCVSRAWKWVNTLKEFSN